MHLPHWVPAGEYGCGRTHTFRSPPRRRQRSAALCRMVVLRHDLARELTWTAASAAFSARPSRRARSPSPPSRRSPLSPPRRRCARSCRPLLPTSPWREGERTGTEVCARFTNRSLLTETTADNLTSGGHADDHLPWGRRAPHSARVGSPIGLPLGTGAARIRPLKEAVSPINAPP